MFDLVQLKLAFSIQLLNFFTNYKNLHLSIQGSNTWYFTDNSFLCHT